MQVVMHILTQEVRFFSQKIIVCENLLFFNLIAIRRKSYVASVNADRRPIETQQNVVIDGRCVADGRS